MANMKENKKALRCLSILTKDKQREKRFLVISSNDVIMVSDDVSKCILNENINNFIRVSMPSILQFNINQH